MTRGPVRLSRTLVVTIVATISLLAIVAVADGRGVHRQEVPDPASLRVTGGMLRKSGGQWEVYDPHHAHLGLGALTCAHNGILHVAFDVAGFATGFGVVVPDDTLTHLGVTVGVSAATNELWLYFYRGHEKNGNARKLSCASSVFDTPHSNLWMTWTQAAPAPAGSETPSS